MITLAKFSVRRPRLALALWLVVAIPLAVIGLGVGRSVSPSLTVTKGTEAYRAQQLSQQAFGPTQLVPILLEGPKAELDFAGPNLVRALVKRPHTRALSAWDAGTASSGLRRSSTAAMILVSVDRTEKQAVSTDLPKIRNLVAANVRAPLRAYVSGQPTIDSALKDASLTALRHGALIAIAVVFVLLLIGLRAPLGAALVTLVAGASTLSALGLMDLLGHAMTVDAVALATGGITGLTAGAGFGLLMLDRFHHEEADHHLAVRRAVADTIGSTGRAVLFAGTMMLAALLLTALLGPTDVLNSLGIGAVLCTLFAIGAAVVVVPAALVLWGGAIDRWQIPAPRWESRIWTRMVSFGGPVVRHPVPFGALAVVALLALALPSLNVSSGPQDVRQLPPGNVARVAFNEIARVMGPGWPTPFDVIVTNPHGPLTSDATLAAINRFETNIAHDTAVASVLGPGTIYANARQLQTFGPSLAHSAKISDKSKKDLLKLIAGLGQAGAGSAQLQTGLQQASSGATQLHSGSSQAGAGAAQLHTGLAQAKSGSLALQTGLTQALAGAQALKTGAAQALAGSATLTAGLGQAAGPVKAGLPAIGTLASASAATLSEVTQAKGRAVSTTSAVSTALGALQAMSSGKSDPQYRAALNALTNANGAATALSAPLAKAYTNAAVATLLAAGVKDQVNKLAPGLAALRTGAGQLQNGIKQLRDGNAQLAGGLGQLSGGGSQLTGGLTQLTAGAGALQTGLGQLTSGTGQLATGLVSGVSPAGQLVTGLGTMQAAVVKSRGQIPSTKDLEQLQRQSPGIFDSGYFVLAAVEGAQPSDRNAATFTINLLKGGTAGQIVVTGRYPVSDSQAKALGGRLSTLAAAFSRSSHLSVAIGGPAGSLFDVSRAASDKLPAVLIGIALGISLLLAVALRSLLIPLTATVLAALCTASGFGVIALLFGGSHPVLGGPGTFDPVSETEILAALFGSTLLYLVTLLVRAREYYVSSGDPQASLRRGMRATIASTSGMAAIAIAALMPFVATELQPVRRIAVAGAVAIALSAYVVVPVILPAVMSLLGRFGWWPTHGPRSAEHHSPRTARHWPRRPIRHRPGARPAQP
jgi:RND superfamily putative drug exporter